LGEMLSSRMRRTMAPTLLPEAAYT
jgi:hypothetical protein